jgi:zinc transport system substrate-binding protein
MKSRALALLLSLVAAGACGRPESAPPRAEAFRVVTSFYPMYVIALNVTQGVPGVSVRALNRTFFGCLHDYQLTTDNMRALSEADALVVNGAGMETFLEKIVRQNPRLRVIEAARGIPLIDSNPHVWVSVAGAIREVRNVARGLAEADPPHADSYAANAEIYVAKLEALKRRMAENLAAARGKPIVTFHEAFPYFAEEWGLKVVAVVERDPGSAPSAKELEETIRAIRSAGVSALYVEPQYPAHAAEAIALETGARIYMLDPAVTGPDDPDGYIRIMEKNLEVLKASL